MADWASVGTAVGTLVLAGATFAAVRSGNRSARIAERALLAGMRPVLVTGRREDPVEPVLFADGRSLEVGAGRPTIEEANGVFYLAFPIGNVGAGLAHLFGYGLEPQTAGETRAGPLGPARHRRGDAPPDASSFRPQQRDLLYGDHEGGQATVTRFVVLPDEPDGWRYDVARHWSVDQRDLPRM